MNEGSLASWEEKLTHKEVKVFLKKKKKLTLNIQEREFGEMQCSVALWGLSRW